jgi:O-antigen/teichoic acid export membrane protein
MSIGKGSLITLLTDVIIFGLGIILSVVLARNLGEEGRGIYTVLTITNGLLALILGLNLGTACTTFLAQGRYRAAEVQTVAAGLALALGALAALSTVLLYALLRDSVFRGVPFGYLLVAVLLVPITIYQSYWNAIMVGTGRMAAMNALNLALNFGNTAALLLAVGAFGGGLPGFLLAWVVGWLGWLAGSLVLTGRGGGFAWPPQSAARDLIGFGLRGHGAGIANQLFLNFDVYVVQVALGLGPLGIYALAVQLARKLWLPLNAVTIAATGRISGLPPGEAMLLTAKVSRTSLLLVSVLAVPLGLISPWLIPFLYGPAFAGAVPPLILSLVGTAGFAVFQVLGVYITAQMGRPGLLSIIAWVELGISIPLYIGLILAYGIAGAGLASSLTYLLAMAGTVVVFRRHTGLPLHALFVPRASDFQDYLRVLTAAWARFPRRKAA